MRVRYDGPTSVVALTGELDAAHCADVARACMSPGHVDVIVDMADLTFMDCSGYGALVASRNVLRTRGGSLSVLDACGEPLRLLTLAEEETAAGTALRRATTGRSVNGHSTARRAASSRWSLSGRPRDAGPGDLHAARGPTAAGFGVGQRPVSRATTGAKVSACSIWRTVYE